MACEQSTQDAFCGSGDGCDLNCGDGDNFLLGLCEEDPDCVNIEEAAEAIVIIIFSCIGVCCCYILLLVFGSCK